MAQRLPEKPMQIQHLLALSSNIFQVLQYCLHGFPTSSRFYNVLCTIRNGFGPSRPTSSRFYNAFCSIRNGFGPSRWQPHA